MKKQTLERRIAALEANIAALHEANRVRQLTMSTLTERDRNLAKAVTALGAAVGYRRCHHPGCSAWVDTDTGRSTDDQSWCWEHILDAVADVHRVTVLNWLREAPPSIRRQAPEKVARTFVDSADLSWWLDQLLAVPR